MGSSSWSKTQRRTHRPVAGASRNSTTACPPVKQCTANVSPATLPRGTATLSSRATHVERANEIQNQQHTTGAAKMNMKLEVVIIPVSDVDSAKAFYEKMGFRLDIDLGDEN